MNKTLIEIRHALFEFFAQENVIHPATQAVLIKFDCADEKLKAAAVVEALKELERLDIVRKVGDEHYILVKPLGMYEKAISFGYDTLSAVATVINSYCKEVGNTKDMCDVTDIKERDFQKLIVIAESQIPKK